MAEVVGRSELLAGTDAPPGGARLPVAHMVCNQSPPVDGAPSLMTFREVETLFHEFGHAAQHMLTQVGEGMVAGIRGVEWDAVELPSQWLEGFCYHKATLLSFARHWQTGEPLPDALYERLVAAKNFRSGTVMLRQIHFASVDLELHARYEPAEEVEEEGKEGGAGGAGASAATGAAAAAKRETVFDRDRAVAARTQVMAPFPEDRFLCSFSHIFAGGYSAGYYSYKWAETMSADAFAAFEEAGLDDDKAVRETGARFRDTVLGLGGSVPPAEVFKRFRGRGPSTEALLKQSGLLVKA
jgi:oligopeptidase A